MSRNGYFESILIHWGALPDVHLGYTPTDRASVYG
jgi:hypothetical protein